MSRSVAVEGFPNYLIYDDGRVFSMKRGIFLKGGQDTDGYKQHSLSNNGSCKTRKVHRLVALAFLPNPNNYPVTHHKDNDKLNNSYKNLEWCTISHNTKEAYKCGALNQAGEKNNACKYSEKEVAEVIKLYASISNISELARVTGIKYGTVYSFVKGIRRSRSAETISKESTPK